MFTVYVDDSGTAPTQKSLVAAALIIPARRIEALEWEWPNILRDFKFDDLHASECATPNRKGQYAGWDDDKVRSVFNRTCSISKKYGVKAISYALKKTDYDEALTEEWRKVGGENHYTWAVRWLIRQLEKWHVNHNFVHPFEFIFDHTEDRKLKEEIERVMEQEDSLYPNRYVGHYTFKNREDLAGLQCVDLLAWSHFQAARKVFENTALNGFAEENWSNYSRHPHIHEWMQMYRDSSKEELIMTMRADQSNLPSVEQRQRWMDEYRAQRRKAGRRVP